MSESMKQEPTEAIRSNSGSEVVGIPGLTAGEDAKSAPTPPSERGVRVPRLVLAGAFPELFGDGAWAPPTHGARVPGIARRFRCHVEYEPMGDCYTFKAPPAPTDPGADLVELLLRGMALLLYNPAPEAKAWIAETEEALKGRA